ncbi:MAG: type II secretion system F family protein [Anaerolineaceae bacterium]|nr:type II secretion system F family protein [Anaerolineaceae bacterium]
MGNDQLYVIIGVIAGVFGFAIVIYGIFSGFKGKHQMSSRIDQFVTADSVIQDFQGDQNKNQIIAREISGSLFSRTIINWIKKILSFFGKFTPAKQSAEIAHLLEVAGNPGNLRSGDFYAIRFLLLIASMFVAFLINRDFKNIDSQNLMLGAGIILVAYLAPNYWLKGKARSRQDEIRRGLPDALDMLSVCASAGLGFDQSLQKISSYWDTELGRELKRTTHEMEMGVSRSVALRNLSNRVDVDDLARFVALIIQAEKVGMSYADVLHSQADQMRVQRMYRARELANKLPGKVIIPIGICIFPAIVIVILGPAIPTLLSVF